MIHETHDPSEFELLVRLVEILIWPITVLIIVLLFRNKIKGVIHRVGSFKASTSGVELTFAPQLDAAKKLFSQLRPNAVSKSAIVLGNSEKHSGTPHEQLLQIKSELQQTLIELAQDSNIAASDKSNIELCKVLEKSGVISHESSELMQSLLNVFHAADPSISQSQVDDIHSLYKAI